jgi:hypothetical protein
MKVIASPRPGYLKLLLFLSFSCVQCPHSPSPITTPPPTLSLSLTSPAPSRDFTNELSKKNAEGKHGCSREALLVHYIRFISMRFLLHSFREEMTNESRLRQTPNNCLSLGITGTRVKGHGSVMTAFVRNQMDAFIRRPQRTFVGFS